MILPLSYNSNTSIVNNRIIMIVNKEIDSNRDALKRAIAAEKGLPFAGIEKIYVDNSKGTEAFHPVFVVVKPASGAVGSSYDVPYYYSLTAAAGKWCYSCSSSYISNVLC